MCRPLGYLNYARVWHDNSGKGNFGSWYLNYMIVRDVQTDQKWVFIADKWFAVEEDDGQVRMLCACFCGVCVRSKIQTIK